MSESDQYQHFSGVFHLKQFSPEYINFKKNKKKTKTRELRAYHYEKPSTLNLKFRHIGDICGSMNFFSQEFERFLAKKVDNDAMNTTLEYIIKNRSFSQLTPKEKENVLVLILSYMARTEARRRSDRLKINSLKQIPNEIYKKCLESLFYGVQQDELVTDETTLRKFQQQQVYQITKFPHILESYYWTLLINNTNVPFIITDNPILTNSHISIIKKYITQVHIPILGYPEGFFMPISPKIGLMLYQFRKIRFPLLPSKISIDNRHLMLALNNRMIRYAERDIVTSFKSLNLLKSIVRWAPKCLEPIKWEHKKLRIDHEKSNVYNLIEHKPKFQCKVCKKHFEEEHQYQQHINDPFVHLKRKILCPYCHSKAKTKEGLYQHIEDKHPIQIKKKDIKI